MYHMAKKRARRGSQKPSKVTRGKKKPANAKTPKGAADLQDAEYGGFVPESVQLAQQVKQLTAIRKRVRELARSDPRLGPAIAAAAIPAPATGTVFLGWCVMTARRRMRTGCQRKERF